MARQYANHSRIRVAVPAGLLIFALALLAGSIAGGRSAPVLAAGDSVPGQYIVVLQPRSNAAAVANEMARTHGLGVQHIYSHAINGFSARIPDARLARIQSDPRVVSVERDQVVSIQDQEVPTGVQRIYAHGNPNIDIDGTDDVRVDVDVAVIDTGIDLTHPDLNVVQSVNCASGSPFSSKCGSGGDDDNGHGSHVAGTIGALDNGIGVVGVTPGARLWSVKVLKSNGSGYMSWIVGGIDYVAANAASIEVANMSLGCECSSPAMDAAISNAVDQGVTFVVAAGNDGKDASTFSPANHPDVITVSALADFDGIPGGLGAATCRVDQDDTLADFSNYGPLVEIAAPGVCITSTWLNGGYSTISGTSMASPHAAGAAALLAASGESDPAAILDILVTQGNTGWSGSEPPAEPILDVSNTAVFVPATVPGNGMDPEPTATPTSTPTQSPSATPTPTPEPATLSLSATGYKVRGLQKADLSWNGAASNTVDIYRDGTRVIEGTSNDGAETDNINLKGGGSYEYRVCEAGSTTSCSNTVTVAF